MKLFQYAIICHPSESEKKKGEKSKLVRTGVGDVDAPSGREIATVLAADEKAAMLLAGRSIPTEFIDKLDQLEIAIRPF